MSKPRGPRAVVGDPAEARNHRGRALRITARETRLALVDYGLVESRAPASGLIDHVAGNAVADEVRIPALSPIRRRLEAGAGVRRSVDHDHRPAAAVLLGRNLKLDIHLTDGDLLRTWRRSIGRGAWLRRRWDHGVLGHLLHATDEEAALVLDGQRAAQKPLRRLALPGSSDNQSQHQHSHRSGSSHRVLLGELRMARRV
jgi:hypothetical protein